MGWGVNGYTASTASASILRTMHRSVVKATDLIRLAKDNNAAAFPDHFGHTQNVLAQGTLIPGNHLLNVYFLLCQTLPFFLH